MVGYLGNISVFPVGLFQGLRLLSGREPHCAVQVVAEYERAVIFRLGRLKKGGSLGPGLHFEIPCVEHAEVVDMRTSKMKVPPQEVH